MSPLPRPAFGLREHLSTIFRHKGKILTIVIAAVLVAGPGSFLLTKVYRAEARFLIQSNRTPFKVGVGLTGELFSPAEFTQKDDVKTEVQIFTSPVLLDKLVDSLGAEYVLRGMRGRWDWILELPSRFVDWFFSLSLVHRVLTAIGLPPEPEDLHFKAVQALSANLGVEPVRQTHVFIVTLEAPDPQFAATALNKLASLYLDHHLAVRQGKMARQFFDEQTAHLHRELQKAEERLQDFKRRWNIVSIDYQKKLTLDQLAQAEARLRETQSAVAEAEVRIANLRKGLASQAQDIPLSNVTERNPLLDQLKTKLLNLTLEHHEYVPGSPAATELAREIAAVRQQIEAENAKVVGAVTSGINKTYQELKKTLLLEEGRRDGLRSRIAELSKQITKHRQAIQLLDERETELRNLLREVKVKQEAYDLYLKKREESRINAVLDQKRISNVTPIQLATVPHKAIRPRKLRNLLLGLIMGLVGGFGSAYIAEYFRRTLATREETQEILGVPVVAVLPLEPERSPEHAAAETDLRNLSQNLIQQSRKQPIRRLFITSTYHGEGKSYLVSALRHALSEQGFRVAILDAPLPEILCSSQFPAWQNLESDCAPTNVPAKVLGNEDPGEHQAASGVTEAKPDSTALESLEQIDDPSLRVPATSEDLVLLDGPAIGLVPEAKAIASAADATLLVVEAERTAAIAAARSIALIEEAGGRLIGVVLNKRRFVIPAWIYNRFLVGDRRAGQSVPQQTHG